MAEAILHTQWTSTQLFQKIWGKERERERLCVIDYDVLCRTAVHVVPLNYCLVVGVVR